MDTRYPFLAGRNSLHILRYIIIHSISCKSTHDPMPHTDTNSHIANYRREPSTSSKARHSERGVMEAFWLFSFTAARVETGAISLSLKVALYWTL